MSGTFYKAMLQPTTVTDINKNHQALVPYIISTLKGILWAPFCTGVQVAATAKKRWPLHPIRPGELQCSFLSFIQCSEMISQLGSWGNDQPGDPTAITGGPPWCHGRRHWKRGSSGWERGRWGQLDYVISCHHSQGDAKGKAMENW